MGMQFCLEQITPQQAREFMEDPAAAYEYYASGAEDQAATVFEQMAAVANREDIAPEAKAQIEAARVQFQAMMAAFGRPARKKPSLVVPERLRFSLEKDWHVLHYALNGTHEGGSSRLADAILGGKVIPDHDQVMGYGPLRCLAPQEVKSVSEALANVDPQSLLSKLDRKDAEAKQIYLAHTLDDLDDWSYLPDLFKDFRAFYADAAQRGNGMLLSIT